jgi:hypothetical protein
MKISAAILSLVPNALFSIEANDYNKIVWNDERTIPTKQQVDAEVVRLQSEYEANEYQRLRKYPPLGDQLDMLWHAIDNGTLNKTSDFYTAIKAVKDAHPKE